MDASSVSQSVRSAGQSVVACLHACIPYEVVARLIQQPPGPNRRTGIGPTAKGGPKHLNKGPFGLKMAVQAPFLGPEPQTVGSEGGGASGSTNTDTRAHRRRQISGHARASSGRGSCCDATLHPSTDRFDHTPPPFDRVAEPNFHFRYTQAPRPRRPSIYPPACVADGGVERPSQQEAIAYRPLIQRYVSACTHTPRSTHGTEQRAAAGGVTV